MPVYLHMNRPYIIEENADRTKWRNEYHKGDYDGIIDLKNQTWYVEERTQIKSASTGADANIGTFDSSNPDIRRALPDTTESVGKMKKDKVDACVQMARSARSVNFPKRYRKFI